VNSWQTGLRSEPPFSRTPVAVANPQPANNGRIWPIARVMVARSTPNATANAVQDPQPQVCQCDHEPIGQPEGWPPPGSDCPQPLPTAPGV